MPRFLFIGQYTEKAAAFLSLRTNFICFYKSVFHLQLQYSITIYQISERLKSAGGTGTERTPCTGSGTGGRNRCKFIKYDLPVGARWRDSAPLQFANQICFVQTSRTDEDNSLSHTFRVCQLPQRGSVKRFVDYNISIREINLQ